MDIGNKLRMAREAKNLSQRELAKLAGTTNSTISMIEKNKVSPTINSLKKVLDVLPISLVEFFSEAEAIDESKRFYYRSHEHPTLPGRSVIMRLMGHHYQSRSITFLDETYLPYSSTGAGLSDEACSHKGEEAGVVLSGKIELTVDGEIAILSAGDSYYFDSSRLHKFKNPFEMPARIVSAASPANF